MTVVEENSPSLPPSKLPVPAFRHAFSAAKLVSGYHALPEHCLTWQDLLHLCQWRLKLLNPRCLINHNAPKPGPAFAYINHFKHGQVSHIHNKSRAHRPIFITLLK